ncbi:hypothetical protein ABLE68_13795 [Nocardioides sp. CN2-186]|uniref:hypothetical protein n=1 Tax=Nocardioides tweenelious TaxID=3156607 RepID=UPI0032B5F71C
MRVVAALVLALLGVGLAGCDSDDEAPADPPSASSTPLADFDTTGLSVARADFCARVAPAAVDEALGGEPTSSDSYGNGDRVRIGGARADVVHEFGCTWTAADGTVARAWVFAPPVTAERAQALRGAAAHADGCAPVRGAPDYGSPSIAVRCGDETAFHGLFGDAWLSCSLDANDVERVGRWCVAVAGAATS